MFGFLLRDERGAVTIDWVALSAGLLVFALVVVYSVMDAAGHLAEAFEAVDTQYAANAKLVSERAPGPWHR